MLGRLRKFAALSLQQQSLLLGAFFLVANLRLTLWILPFRIVRQLVARAAIPGTPKCRVHSTASIETLTAAVRIVSRFVPVATCLTQALAGEILLARAGHAPTLRIGVLRADGRFKAHAWVECGGRIVIGEVAGIEEFKPLPAL